MATKAKTVTTVRSVSLIEAATLIASTPEAVYFLRGEPGIGKSSLLGEIKRLTGYDSTYIDCPRLDLGDIAIPFIDREAGVARYYPNAAFGLHTGRPVAICLDEFTKAARPVQNMLHPLFEKSGRRLADQKLTKGSLVFLTGNLTSDGVGDQIAMHTLNRIVPLNVRKPTGPEWRKWAVSSERINPTVIAWVEKFEDELFASYLDMPEGKENPYVFNPRAVQAAFVSPRSLETASDILNAKDGGNNVTYDVLVAALSGAIGEPGALSLMSFVEYADQLPANEDILADPKGTPLPRLPGAFNIVVNRLCKIAERNTFDAIMEYMNRMPREWQMVFVKNITSMPTKQALAFGNKLFGQWLATNQALL